MTFHVATRRFTAETRHASSNRRGLWAWFACAVEPCPAVEGMSVALALADESEIPREFRQPLLSGFRTGLTEMADCGEWFCSMKVEIVRGRYHDADSTPEAFGLRARSLVREMRHYLADVRALRALDPRWCTPDVLALAKHAHEARDHSALPALADALEEAGCDFALLLEHCRSGCDHGGACWAVQLALASPGEVLL